MKKLISHYFKVGLGGAILVWVGYVLPDFIASLLLRILFVGCGLYILYYAMRGAMR